MYKDQNTSQTEITHQFYHYCKFSLWIQVWFSFSIEDPHQFIEGFIPKNFDFLETEMIRIWSQIMTVNNLFQYKREIIDENKWHTRIVDSVYYQWFICICTLRCMKIGVTLWYRQIQLYVKNPIKVSLTVPELLISTNFVWKLKFSNFFVFLVDFCDNCYLPFFVPLISNLRSDFQNCFAFNIHSNEIRKRYQMSNTFENLYGVIWLTVPLI